MSERAIECTDGSWCSVHRTQDGQGMSERVIDCTACQNAACKDNEHEKKHQRHHRVELRGSLNKHK